MEFNPKGHYLLFAGGDRREVYLQEGRCYNIKHERLPSDTKWLDANGYAMNAELRREVINQMTQAKYQKELEELNAKIAAESKKLQDEQARQLDQHYKQLTQVSSPPESSLEYTDVEKQFMAPAPSPDPFEGVTDDSELVLAGGGSDPFEGLAPAPSERKAVKGEVKVRRRKTS